MIRRAVGFVLVTLCFVTVCPMPLAAAEDLKSDEYYELYRTLADTLDQIERNYVKDISKRELMEAAIAGIMAKLDEYSTYIKPEDLSQFRTAVESQFGGIGIQINVENGVLRVMSPLVDTPAYRAGILAGDRIVEIDGESTDGISRDDAVRRLKGEPGTKVTLTVVHAQSADRKTVEITREIIHVETVMGDHRGEDDHWEFMLDRDKRIGYIRLAAFSRDTASELQDALERLKVENVRGLILDLRFNPGGLLTSAIEVSDEFLRQGRIVSTAGRNVKERTWDAKADGTFEDLPLAVLVNHYSASASEIVAACLQDHQRAVIVGERTWGKGSVQNVVELDGGKSALKLTTASYRRPSGKNIHRFEGAPEDEWGVKPSDGFEVRLNPTETRQLVQHQRFRDMLHASVPAPMPADGDEIDKPNEAKPNEPAAGAAPDTPAEPNAATKPADDTSNTPPANGDPTDAKAPAKKKADSFVDRQLQKALEYLGGELARAG